MPWPTPDETKSEYISRAIPAIMKDTGKDSKTAAAQAYGMWKQKKPRKREGIDLNQAYEYTVHEDDFPDARAFRFTTEDDTPYTVFLNIDDLKLTEPSPRVMNVLFGVDKGKKGVDYSRREVGVRTMYRILATVVKCILQTLNDDPLILMITFISDNEEDALSSKRGRFQAYSTMAKQLAEYLEWKSHVTVADSNWFVRYSVIHPSLSQDEDVDDWISLEEKSSKLIDRVDHEDAHGFYHIIQEGISSKYWNNGGPTRDQNWHKTFTDINQGDAGIELQQGFDLNKREALYLNRTPKDKGYTKMDKNLDNLGYLDWVTIAGTHHKGPIVEADGNIAYVDCEICGRTIPVEDGMYALEEATAELDEDVGMSGDFQAHAPEHMLTGSPISLRTGRSGETGLSRAKRGTLKDDSWDSAYRKTISNSFLREEIYAVAKDQLPLQGGSNLKTRLLGKNVVMVVTDPVTKGNPVDAMPGPPSGFIAYGRGGILKNQLWIDGGPGGSPDGHKSGTTMGFYWGVTREAQRGGQRVLMLRGRSGATLEQYEAFFRNNLDLILRDTVGKIPPAR